jgi:TRAP-type C4-dicarboxylate transport system substrate-binding protein
VVNLADLKGLRLRAPNKTVAAALAHVGAVPAVLQVDEVMDAVRSGTIDGIVTNWGNPLPGFNDCMKLHTEIQFYTAAFFIVMKRETYRRLPGDVRRIIDELSGEAWSAKLGALWDKWDRPVRQGASGPGHQIIVPDTATLAAWSEGLRPVTERYLADLAARGFPNARAAYERLADTLRR